MASYVLKRNEDGAYVAPPGQRGSYTRRLENARKFRTREEAERNACGNEYVETLEQAAGVRP
jgi:hypothetical protein